MQRVIISSIFFLLSITAKSQAHLEMPEDSIRAMYPEKTWKDDYTKSGQRYISADMVYGTFAYYFNKKTLLCDYCMQFPFNLVNLNAQVEAYNKKYVITSDTSWTAYLDEGGIIYIILVYDKGSRVSYFSYSETKWKIYQDLY